LCKNIARKGSVSDELYFFWRVVFHIKKKRNGILICLILAFSIYLIFKAETEKFVYTSGVLIFLKSLMMPFE